MFRKKRKDPFKEIQACLQKRDYKGALDWFHTLLQKDPKNTQIRLRFADTLVLAGNKKEAVKQLRQVADQLGDKGFVIRAIAINKKILQIDPTQTDVRDKLAEMQDQRGSMGKRKPRLAEVLRRPGEPIRRPDGTEEVPEDDEEPEVDEPAAVVAEEEEPAPNPLPLVPPPPKDAPLRRVEPEPEPEPVVAEEPEALPELSLEESMAMEFGSASVAASPPAEEAPAVVEPEIVTASSGSEPEIVAASDAGFESLADGEAPTPESAEVSFSEEPAFTEDPVFEEAPLDIGGAEIEDPPSSPEIVLDVEAPEAPEVAPVVLEPEVESLEIEAEAPVLEVEPMVLSAESAPEVEASSEEDLVLVDPSSVEVIEIPDEAPSAHATPLVDDDPVVIADESTLEIPEEDAGIIVPGEEMEVVEFQLDEEPENSEEESAALLGALGEDIDSMIDSIISDVASPSIVEAEDDGEPPTHIPLFSDLTTPEFIDVALLMMRRVFKAGEVAVREGDPGDSMFVISTGEVRATVERDGQQLPVATLRDGDFFGEMAVLSGEPRTATVTAVKNTEVLELNRENLQVICSRHPHVEAKIRLSYDERVSNSPG